MKLSELKKLASENGISLKHLNGKMLKKSELAEKLMPKGVMVKSPKKSRKPSRKKSRKPKKASRKPKKASRKPKKTSRKKSRKPKKASRKPKKTSRKKSRKPKKASRKPKKTSRKKSRKPKKASRKPKKTSRKKSRKPKKKSKTRSGKRKLNAHMVFVGKHRSKVEKKLKAQGKKGRELFSATGKELGKMYREQKKTYKMDDDDDMKPPKGLKRRTAMEPLVSCVDFLERREKLYELRKGLISVDQRNDHKLNELFDDAIKQAAAEQLTKSIKDFEIELMRIPVIFLEKKKIYLQDLRRQLEDKIKEIEKELDEIGIRLPTRCQPGQY